MSTRKERDLRTVLVAGRGEIAARVFRACRETGLTSVAVYSDVDAGSVWSRKADLSVRLPGVSVAETYRNVDALLAAARLVGADAVHPGYGFLSEDPEFAAACTGAGLAFVGPDPDAMRAMGSKVSARAVARSVGVPVIPGADGEGLSLEDLAREAQRMGFPVLVKASAGGGGRGMRVVRHPDAFADLAHAARAEAAAAFGDDRVFVERYFDRARHVEVQVLGDRHGHLVHLFERECSIQRRHQKIIEESPSVALEPEMRAAITDAAVALARAVGYESAGTVEFLLDDKGDFYFLEMNTRLQVEHPVTEMVTGVDLVVAQLQVAAGAQLPFGQHELAQHGHAVECRVYAEDPAAGFVPSVGTIAYYRGPAGPHVRCDDGVATGSQITPHYDAMLAKVVTAGWDRDEAVQRMGQALADTVVLGITTNVPFLQDVVRHGAFLSANLHTRFLEEHFPDWRPSTSPSEEEWLALAAFESLNAGDDASADVPAAAPAAWPDPWSVTEAWRNVR